MSQETAARSERTHALGKRTALQVILIIALAVVLRTIVLELDNIDCGGAPFKQFLFICDLGFFVLPILLITAFLSAVIPLITRVWQFLLIPAWSMRCCAA